MINSPMELLLKMKDYDFVYDTKLGKVMNKNAEEQKEYIFKILDLLHENYDRVKYVDDMGSEKTGKKAWAVMFSQKFAMMDKRLPIPQVPFSIKFDGIPDPLLKAKHAYYLLIGFFQECNDEICVFLNFKDAECRKYYKKLMKDNKVLVK